MSKLKIMSFNLKTCSEQVFETRIDRICAVIEHHAPDLIGFQEVQPWMQNLLRKHLSDYVLIGLGRATDYLGEAMTIAFKIGRCELYALEQFWLSPTPTLPGSTFGGDQSGCPRMALSARIVLLPERKTIRFCNTHLDHQGAHARFLGMMEILQHISAFEEPIILTGDMNAEPNAPEIALACSVLSGRGFGNRTEGIGGTFHDWGKIDPIQIDYIFSDLKATRSFVVPEPDENGFYSDHYAVMAELEIG